MKRIGRWAVNILAGVSLVLCVAVCVLWLRGSRTTDQFSVKSKGGRAYDLHCGSRRITLSTFTPWPRDDQPMTWHTQPTGSILVPPYTLGFNPGALTERQALGVQIVHGPGELVVIDLSERLTFHWKSQPPSKQVQSFLISIPHWLLLAGAALPALLILPPRACRRLRTRRRVRWGLCPACGYDLRASSDRCPECGAVPASPPAKQQRSRQQRSRQQRSRDCFPG